MTKIKTLLKNTSNNDNQIKELENQKGMLKLRIQFLNADLLFFENTVKELDKQINKLKKDDYIQSKKNK